MKNISDRKMICLAIIAGSLVAFIRGLVKYFTNTNPVVYHYKDNQLFYNIGYFIGANSFFLHGMIIIIFTYLLVKKPSVAK